MDNIQNSTYYLKINPDILPETNFIYKLLIKI